MSLKNKYIVIKFILLVGVAIPAPISFALEPTKDECIRLVSANRYFDPPLFPDLRIDPNFEMKSINGVGTMDDDRIDLFKTMLARTAGPKELALRDYGKKGDEVFQALTEIDPHYDVLAADPGVVIHLEKFKKFVKKHGKLGSPWETRKAFREYLGTKTVYRGVALTAEEYAKVMKYGMYPQDLIFTSDELAHVLATTRRLDDVRTNMDFIRILDRGSSLAVQGRVAANSDALLTLSVTDYPEVAFAFALNSAIRRRKYGSDAHVYVFPIEAHVLDLVYFGDKVALPSHWRQLSPNGSLKAVITMEGPNLDNKIRILEVPLSPAVESFAFLGFGPKELGKATKVDMAEFEKKFKECEVLTGVNYSSYPYGSEKNLLPELRDFSWIRERYKLTNDR